MVRSDARWRINTRPRFTVLELGEYMAAEDGPRETMLRDMRYERIARTLVYRHLRQAVASFLASPTRDLSILSRCRMQLEEERLTASNPTQKENINYEIRALESFERSLNALALAGLTLTRAPAATPLKIEGVNVSVQPTAHILVRRPRGVDLVGAVVVDLAKGVMPRTTEAQVKCEMGMKHAAVLVHEYVASTQGQKGTKPSPEHAIIFHSHRQERICAPSNYRKMMRNVEAVCRNIARSWEGIRPPANFDPAQAIVRR